MIGESRQICVVEIRSWDKVNKLNRVRTDLHAFGT